VRVYFSPKLTSYLFPPLPSYCFLDSGLIVSAGPVGGFPPYKYLWSNGSTLSKTFFSIGTYVLRISDQSGCPPVFDTITVTIDTPHVDAGPSDTVCYGYTGSVGLLATGALYYRWQPDSTMSALNIPNPRVKPKKTTTYYVSGFSTVGEYIDNSDFSKGNTGFTSSYGYTSNLWPEGYYYVGNNPHATHPNWCTCGDHTTGTGNMMIINGATVAGVSIYSKTVDVIPYTSYAFSIWIQSVHPLNPAKLQFNVNGMLLGAPFTILSTVGLWQNFYTIWYSGPSSVATISIINQNTIANGNDFALDDISFASVCPNEDSVTVYVSNISITSNIKNNNCYVGNNGFIELNVSGGIAPYKYLWSTGDTTKNLRNLRAGKYYILITDKGGCTYHDSFTITQPDSLYINTITNNISCYNSHNGSINLTVRGGATPYNFRWSSGQTTKDINNLIAGGYGVTVTDSHGCVIRDSTVISEPNKLTITHTLINVSCNNGNNGTVNLTVTGGTTPYSYKWSSGQITEDISNLIAGGYGVAVTDSHRCVIRDTAVISQPNKLTISHIKTNVSCNNGNNGSVNISLTGGTTPYNFKWTNGKTTEDIINLMAGGYGVTVTDSHGCVIRDTALISQPGKLNINHTQTNVNCYNENNGSVNITISGGTTPYSFRWTSGQTTEDINILIAGGYGVTVTDSHGCVIRDSAIISQPNKLTISHTQTNVSCNNGNNGSVNITVNGGTTPYTYRWSSGQATEDISNLLSGGYGVTVTDNHGCVIRDTAVISQPNKLTISHTKTNVSCYNGNNGSVNITLTGGLTPYNFKWTNSQTTEDINNLIAGGYGVTVTDSHGCVIRDTAVISQPTKLLISHTQTNVSCYNGNNGSINITITGGTTPYNYKWTNGQTTEDISSLVANGYGVIVTDSHGCVIKDTAVISQPTKIMISQTQTNVSCNNGNNGSINITITGGTTPYNYKWTNGQTTEDISSLVANGYGVTVTDFHGCLIRDTAIIRQPNKLTISHTQTYVSCYNGNNGLINITLTGGTTPYNFKWTNSQTTEDLNNLIAGGYGVTVTDSHGCVIRDTAVISQPSKLMISHTQTNVSCNNGNNGSINLTIIGGTTPYSYKWTSGQTTKDINNLVAGGYGVTVTDSHGCVIRDSAIISQPTKLIISHIQMNVSCNNGNNGSVNITVSGGTTPYSYRWTSGQTTENINILVAGGYGVTVTDSHGCVIRDTAVISQPSKLVISHIQTNVSCYNGNNGSINITVTGGTNTYFYKWSNAQITKNINNLVAGAYSVSVTDTHGCVIRDTAVISQPPQLIISHTQKDVNCNGENNGSVNLTVSGGTIPYNYKWSNGQTTKDINNLVAGGYGVTVTDSHGCVIRDTIVISQPIKLTILHLQMNVSCNNGNNGLINQTVNGGTTPYSYRWSNGLTTKDINNLVAGVYSVIVTDSQGCVIRDTAIIRQPAKLTISHALRNVNCNGENNGSINLIVSGGTSTYNYIWSNGQTTEDINNLIAGGYGVTVTDSHGCVIRDTAIISQPAKLTIGHTLRNVNCYGENNGSVNLTVNGGTSPYNFNWSSGQTTEDINNLVAGGYGVTVTDSHGCMIKDTASISQPAKLTISHILRNVNCYGENNGSIDITVSGGTKSYNYNWTNGQTTEDINNLVSGGYGITVTDSHGCVIRDTAFISQPTKLAIGHTLRNVNCYGENNGSINLIVSGGTSTYNYTWSNGQTTEDINNLIAGGYGVTVSDSHGCVIRDTAIIIQPAKLTISHTLRNVNCFGENNGSIDITVNGGTSPYNYNWSSGQTTEDINKLISGGYGVTVTDSHGCMIKDTVSISQPAKLTINHTSMNVNCYGENNGSIDITVSGGTKRYNYNWTNGQTTEDINNLIASGYGVTVSDSHGCVIRDTALISQPTKLAIGLTLRNVNCYGENNGSINLIVSGGTSTYNYIWSNGQTTEDINNLIAGGYGVTVSDSHGCVIRDTAIISQPAKLTISHTSRNVNCYGENNGSIDITVSGGIKSYNYNWTTGQTTEDINNLVAGGYGLTVTDSHGCVIKDTVTISQPAKLTISHTIRNVNCYGENNGSIDITVSGGTKSYNYNWTGGQPTEDIYKLIASGYGVAVTDSHGCVIRDSVVISQPSKLTISHTYKNVNCYGENNGSVDLTVNGGTSPYNYNWTSGQTTEVINNLLTGGYGVTVTDSHRCVIRDTIVISQPAKLTISHRLRNVNCYGENNGLIDITVSGGTKLYDYNWSSGQTTDDINNLIAGGYGVTVTDSHGCVIRDTAVISQPTELIIGHTLRNVNCYGENNGSIDITAGGGTIPYNYNWTSGQTTEDINNLAVGKYSITVTDSHGCKIWDTAVINQPARLTISHTLINVNCYGENNGSINLTLNGGTLPYNYIWSSNQTIKDINNLLSGGYGVTVTDSHGCVIRDTAVINQPTKLTISHTLRNVNCYGENNGSIDITVSGGTKLYNYNWTSGQTTDDINNLIAGGYGVTVTDSHGCVIRDTAIISQPAILSISHKLTNVSCFKGANGSINLTINGGTTPYNYKWTSGQTTEDINNLVSGSYGVTVTDSHGCKIRDTAEISQPTKLMITQSLTNVSCYNGNNGAINLTVSGGTTSYHYRWSNGQTTEDIKNLVAGYYSLVVEDTMKCEIKVSFMISQPTPLSISLEITDATCFNKKDGSVEVHVMGGSSPYKYIWSNGDTLNKIYKLGAGLYFLNVLDKNICQKNDSATINQPPPVLIVDYTIKNISCHKNRDGSIDLNVKGGTPPYYYKWSNEEKTQDLKGLSAGYYSVTVSDANYCVFIDSLRIIEPQPLDIQYFTKDEKCKGDKDGYINLSVTGGVNPYHFRWSTQDTIEDIKGLSSGRYNVSITDANGCGVNMDNILISTSPLPEPKIYSEERALYCEQDSFILSVTDPFIKYIWNTGDTGRYIVVKKPGSYYVKVTNKDQCSDISKAIKVDIQNPYDAVKLQKEYFFCPDEEKEIILNTGIVNGAKYEWVPNNETTSQISVNKEGEYSVNISKGNCNIKFTAYVYELCEPSIFIPNVFTPNSDAHNESFFPVTRYIDTLTFIIFNRWGEILYRGFGIEDKWDGTFDNEIVMQDTYCYIVYYKNKKWGWKQKSGSVNVLR
jgi:gliding motility-associated-like protein